MPRNNLCKFPFFVTIKAKGRKRLLRVASTVDDPYIVVDIYQVNKDGFDSIKASVKLWLQRYEDGRVVSRISVCDSAGDPKFKEVEVYRAPIERSLEHDQPTSIQLLTL